jgi:TPR repeat protein
MTTISSTSLSDIKYPVTSFDSEKKESVSNILSPQIQDSLFDLNHEIKKIELKAKKITAIQTKIQEAIEELYQLALSYQQGLDGDEDHEQAAVLFKKAATLDHLPSINALGFCYQHGFGILANGQEAFSLYLKAASLGFQPAISNLTSCYNNGVGSIEDRKKAEELFQKLAQEKENPQQSIVTSTPQ